MKRFDDEFMKPEIFCGAVTTFEIDCDEYHCPTEYYMEDENHENIVHLDGVNKLGRLSASGYLDSTDWELHDSKTSDQKIIDQLADTFEVGQ